MIFIFIYINNYFIYYYVFFLQYKQIMCQRRAQILLESEDLISFIG